MKRAEKIEKELKAIFKDKISDNDLMEFAWGLESIKQIIQERSYLKASVNFEAIKKILIDDYRKWIRGEKECFLGNKIIKAPKILPNVGTIHGSIPMIMEELSKGIVRPEFRRPESSEKVRAFPEYIKPIESLDDIDDNEEHTIPHWAAALEVHDTTVRNWMGIRLVKGSRGGTYILVARKVHGKWLIKGKDFKIYLEKIRFFQDRADGKVSFFSLGKVGKAK